MSVSIRLAAAIAAAVSLPCFAQTFPQTFPSKPIRVLIAAAPATPTDTLARALVDPLGRALNQPIIVENRVGADGIIGTEQCARAPADGYTLCATASNVMIWNVVLRPKLPYDTLRDFAPVLHAGFFDSALLVHPSIPASSVTQLFDYAKANPGKVNWGHFGVNSTGYMYQEWFKRSKNVPFYPVPYKTQPQSNTALVIGETHVGVNSLANMATHIRSGKVKALAVTASRRLDWLPDVPTFDEEGIKLPLRTWFGYHYQAAIPREMVMRMNGEIRKVMSTPDYQEKIFARTFVNPNLGTPEEFDAFIRAQLKQVAELVAYLGIKAED